jgi:hypothetical protein
MLKVFIFFSVLGSDFVWSRFSLRLFLHQSIQPRRYRQIERRSFAKQNFLKQQQHLLDQQKDCSSINKIIVFRLAKTLFSKTRFG